MEHFENHHLLAFGNLLSLRFRAFHYGCDTGSWTSRLPVSRLIVIFADPGGSAFADDREEVPLIPGRAVLVPAFHRIRHRQEPGIDLLSIHFNLRLFDQVELPGDRPGHLYHTMIPEKLAPLKAELDRPHPFRLLLTLDALCWEMFARFFTNAPTGVDETVRRYRDFAPLFEYMQEHCTAGVSVGEMADVLKMNEETFAAKFTRAAGMPPRQFFNRMLLAEAARRLTGTSDSIRKIARDLKFCNEFYFSRFFRRGLGVPPSEYRKHYR